MIFLASVRWLSFTVYLVGILSFIGAAYNLYLFSTTQHGPKIVLTKNFSEADFNEISVLNFHFIPLILGLPLILNQFSYYYSLDKIKVCGTLDAKIFANNHVEINV